MKKWQIIKFFSNLKPSKIAGKIKEMAKIEFGIVGIPDKKKPEKCWHWYRLWIDNKKYLCGFCGKIIFKPRNKFKEFLISIYLKFRKPCFACEIERAMEQRTRITTLQFKKMIGRKKIDFSKDKNAHLLEFKKMTEGKIIRLKHHHNLICSIKYWIESWLIRK